MNRFVNGNGDGNHESDKTKNIPNVIDATKQPDPSSITMQGHYQRTVQASSNSALIGNSPGLINALYGQGTNTNQATSSQQQPLAHESQTTNALPTGGIGRAGTNPVIGQGAQNFAMCVAGGGSNAASVMMGMPIATHLESLQSVCYPQQASMYSEQARVPTSLPQHQPVVAANLGHNSIQSNSASNNPQLNTPSRGTSPLNSITAKKRPDSTDVDVSDREVKRLKSVDRRNDFVETVSTNASFNPGDNKNLNPAAKQFSEHYALENENEKCAIAGKPSATSANSRDPLKSSKEKEEVNLTPEALEQKRRNERNLREQQRSNKISQQIKELRTVLSESNIPFKPTKYSILMSVVDYIKQLQSRATFLDAEHKKLINTMNQMSKMVNSGQVAPPTMNSDSEIASVEADNDILVVPGLDYHNLFNQCSAALGVTALDGRFLDCNNEFEIISGYSKDQLTHQSIFNLLTCSNMQDVFGAMGQMIKENSTQGVSPKRNFWSGVVSPYKRQHVNLFMNITLAKSSEGTPKFFNCVLTTLV